MSKEINKEINEVEHSHEWVLSKELSKSNKRMFIIVIIETILLFLVVFGAMYERLKYDYTSYDVQQDGEWGNTFIDGGNEGDINYGAENTSTQEGIEEQK